VISAGTLSQQGKFAQLFVCRAFSPFLIGETYCPKALPLGWDIVGFQPRNGASLRLVPDTTEVCNLYR